MDFISFIIGLVTGGIISVGSFLLSKFFRLKSQKNANKTNG
jgi:hypothetical protein